jgi:signal transduction histidine kinase
MADTDDTASQEVEAVLSAVERRLDRLRYDLHDGPQQDVHLLGLDLRLFREQLLLSIAENPHRDLLIGRLDDLAAQLSALDGDLRRLLNTFESPFLTAGSFVDAVADIAGSFAARTGIQPQTELAGDLDQLTDSRQITLLAVIREALSNVRKHSDATAVTVNVAAGAHGVDARVVDNGNGFDAETKVVQAERDGHLGLVGMRERVRMLGGKTDIVSRNGGPTTISVSLPPWPPPRA